MRHLTWAWRRLSGLFGAGPWRRQIHGGSWLTRPAEIAGKAGDGAHAGPSLGPRPRFAAAQASPARSGTYRSALPSRPFMARMPLRGYAVEPSAAGDAVDILDRPRQRHGSPRLAAVLAAENLTLVASTYVDLVRI